MLCANLNTLINRVYPGIGNPRPQKDQYFLNCIILCPRNDEVHVINKAIPQQFNPVPNAEVYILRSVDSVSEEDGMQPNFNTAYCYYRRKGAKQPDFNTVYCYHRELIEESKAT